MSEIEDEINDMKEGRELYLDSQVFSGRSEAVELVGFAKVFLDANFTSEQVEKFILAKMYNDRDIRISYINKEMNENLGGVREEGTEEDDCQCDNCKKRRGETDEPQL